MRVVGSGRVRLDTHNNVSLPGHQGTTTENLTVIIHRCVFIFLPSSEEPFSDTADQVAGYSLQASTAFKVSQRKKFERMSVGGPATTSPDQQCQRKDTSVYTNSFKNRRLTPMSLP